MIARLCFVLCTLWAVFILFLLAVMADGQGGLDKVPDEMVGTAIIVAIAPPFLIAGAARVLRWVAGGTR